MLAVMHIRFITTGGTIDKVYFDDLSQYEVGESHVEHMLKDGLVQFDYDVVPLLQKDSLEMAAADRKKLRDFIEKDDASHYIVTHGTDTMPETAEALLGLDGKTIVLTVRSARHASAVPMPTSMSAWRWLRCRLPRPAFTSR
jgi:L-asparaginase